MRDAMIRRGPDEAGIKLLPHIGLGHRRLKVIDLSERGRQPMCNEDESLWTVFNGEIYNFWELRQELLKAGHRFRSGTDTEVVLHGYEEWGLEGLLRRVNGPFAFALWDANTTTLWLARDRLGKKPLYYGDWKGRFCFSSDIKSLWLVAHQSLEVSFESIARFLYWGYIPGPDTVFCEVRQLPPGCWLELRPTGGRVGRYWRLSFRKKKSLSFSDALLAVDDELRQAVERRLYSDVPLGAFLSGGVDSGLVVHYMAQLCGSPVRTFSIGFEAVQHDERAYARQVAALCRTQHTEETVRSDAKAVLPTLVWEFGQPFGDAAAIPTYHVARVAREEVTVALTGDGGDESFAGYSHHQGRFLGHLTARLLPAQLINLLVAQTGASNQRGGDSIGSSIKRFLRYASSDPLLSMSNVNYWNLAQLQALWPSGVGEAFDHDTLLQSVLTEMQEFDGDRPLDRALYLDFAALLPYNYNVKVDVATMSNSLEARSPFLDYKVAELAAGLPTGYKLRPWDRKHLLKRLASRHLPHEVVFRPKHGFSVPMNEWMSGSWSKTVRDVVFGPSARGRGLFDFDYLELCWNQHQNGTARHGHRFWLLLWLELWFQFFVDGARTAEQPLD